MSTFPGYTLPAELRRLRDQVRRIVHDEIIPIARVIDPAVQVHGGYGVSKEVHRMGIARSSGGQTPTF